MSLIWRSRWYSGGDDHGQGHDSQYEPKSQESTLRKYCCQLATLVSVGQSPASLRQQDTASVFLAFMIHGRPNASGLH